MRRKILAGMSLTLMGVIGCADEAVMDGEVGDDVATIQQRAKAQNWVLDYDWLGHAGSRLGHQVAVGGGVHLVGRYATSGQVPDGFSIYEQDSSDPSQWHFRGSVEGSSAATNLAVDGLAIGDELIVATARGRLALYERDSWTQDWEEVGSLYEDAAAIDQELGRSLDVNDTQIIAGSRPRSFTAAAGEAYIYERVSGSSGAQAWSQVARLRLPAPYRAADDWYFGADVAIDGDWAVVGAPEGVAEPVTESGKAFVFHRDEGGPGAWGMVAELSADLVSNGDRFGQSVEISGDTVFVGAPWDNGTRWASSGAVYVFGRDEGGPNAWGFQRRLTPEDSDHRALYGWALSVRGDTLVVGAPNAGSESGVNIEGQGAVYVYSRHEGGAGAWGRTTIVDASSNEEGQDFGASLALDEQGSEIALMVGAPYFDDNSSNAHRGGAFLYRGDLVLEASDVSLTTEEDQTVTAMVGGGDVEVSATTGAAHGSVSFSGGSVTYTPEADFYGDDAFDYTIIDSGGRTAMGEVVVEVLAINDAPVAFDQTVTTEKGEAVAIELHGEDVEGDALSFEVVGGPSHGTYVDGIYRPEGDFVGEDVLRFVANDGELDSEVARVTIVVFTGNVAPIAQDQRVVTTQGEAVTIELQAVDGNEDPLSFEVVEGPSQGSFEDGVYTPDAGFVGEDSFRFVASDGELSSNEATVTIVVESDEEPGDEEPGDEEPGDEEPDDEEPGDEEPGDEEPVGRGDSVAESGGCSVAGGSGDWGGAFWLIAALGGLAWRRRQV